MHVNLGATAEASDRFKEWVIRKSRQDVNRCYQCGKCTAGCPVAKDMDVAPHQVLRLLQLGLKDEILDSKAIWLCSTCSTCTTRCPMNIDLAAIMDCLRVTAKREGRVRAAKSISLFNDVFISSIRKYGRTHEFGVGMDHNLRTGRLMKDVDIACGLLIQGRLNLLPVRIKGRDEMVRIFDEVRKLEEKE